MSFVKKVLLTAAVAAVGLAGSVVAPSPTQAASAGTIEFIGAFHAPPVGVPLVHDPNGGGARLESYTCANAAGATAHTGGLPAGTCSLSGAGSYGANAAGIGGHCGLGSGRLSGGFSLSNGHHYGFDVAYDFAGGTFHATGTAYGYHTGEAGVFTINAVAVHGIDRVAGCLDTTLRTWEVVGTAQFQSL